MQPTKLQSTILILAVVVFVAACIGETQSEYKAVTRKAATHDGNPGDPIKYVVIEKSENGSVRIIDSIPIYIEDSFVPEHYLHNDLYYSFNRILSLSLRWSSFVNGYRIREDSLEYLTTLYFDSKSWCNCIPDGNRARIRCREGLEYVIDLDRFEVVDTLRFEPDAAEEK